VQDRYERASFNSKPYLQTAPAVSNERYTASFRHMRCRLVFSRSWFS